MSLFNVTWQTTGKGQLVTHTGLPWQEAMNHLMQSAMDAWADADPTATIDSGDDTEPMIEFMRAAGDAGPGMPFEATVDGITWRLVAVRV